LAAGDFIVMLQVTTNVESYRPKCTWCMFEYLKYLYYTGHQLLFYLRRNSINGSHEATPNHSVKLRRPLSFSGSLCTLNTCDVWCNPKKRIQASQSMSLMRLCMWTTCTSFCTVCIIFVFWGNSIGPVGINRGRCLEKLGAVNSILLVRSRIGRGWVGFKLSAWRRYFVRVASCPPHVFGLVRVDPSVWVGIVGVCDVWVASHR